MPTATAEFSLVLPANWLTIDVTGDRRINDDVEALLRQGAVTDEAFRTHRGRIEKQLRAVVRSVRAESLSMAAVMISVQDDILPLFASMTVAVAERLDGYRGRPNADISMVELPSTGPAVLQRFTDSSIDPQTGVNITAAVFQYLVPMPDQRRRLILTFASPDTEPVLLAAFGELFAAVAESLSFENGSEN